MLPSARPDQTFLCRKKNKNITVSQERICRSERQRDRQREKERTEWEQSCRVGWTFFFKRKRGQNGSKVVELDGLFFLLYIKVKINENIRLCFQKT